MLELSGITARYGRIRALEEISLTVAPGEAVAVLGPNGAGKTTLMRVIAGALQPVHGRVLLDGVDVTSATADARSRAGVALCPEGRGIFTTLTVERNLLLGASPLRARLGARAARAATGAGLERTYELFPVLQERRHASGGALSGGQQQMLAIARALMSEPKLILLDEPSLGLAPIVVDDLYRRLAVLRDAGQTLVVVEESPERALRVASRAYVLRLGSVALAGPTEEVRGHPVLRAVYLGERAEVTA